MTSWAYSPTYGARVALGPTQAAVYSCVMALTADGRRPCVTLADLSARVGKPVSSVHVALGRLRALGLIGMAARMGRTGGHRLWRAGHSAIRMGLDPARHRRAIARIVRRWWSATAFTRRELEARPVPAPDAPGTVGPAGDPPAAPGPSFGELLRRHGFRPWWDQDGGRDDDATRDRPGQPDASSGTLAP